MIFIKLMILIFGFIVSSSSKSTIVAIDERWVCAVKQSCVGCLQLSHCSWCQTEKKCFSKNVPTFENYCKDNIIESDDSELSIEDKAICACSGHGELVESRCRPPFASDGSDCSGRGQCVCGRCACDPNPDPEHPTKMIMGEYCEFDNFSCDGPRCNEGPYSLSQPRNADGGLEDD